MTNHVDSIENIQVVINNVKRDAVRVKVDGHVIEAVELDMADQWDFMELAGAQLENHAWVNTALIAASVVSIDGVPQLAAAKTRDQIRQVLRKIGVNGVDALHMAFNVPESKQAESVDVNTSAMGN